MASHRSFITIEESLAGTLLRDWRRRVASVAVKRAVAAAERDDLPEAQRAIASLSFIPTMEARAGHVEQLALSAYLLGQSFFAGGRVERTRLARAVEQVPPQIETAARALFAGLEQSVEAIKEAAREVLVEPEARAVAPDASTVGATDVQKAVIPGLAGRLNAAVATGGARVVETAANLTTSRLAAYGALVQAGDSGEGSYQVSEVLDRRTCPVCRRMHGRTFSVGPARGRLETQLLTPSPLDLKTSSPFPSSSRGGVRELTSLSGDELTDRGWDTPPYHPACRGILVPAGSVNPDEIIPFTPLTEGLTLAEAAANELALAKG